MLHFYHISRDASDEKIESLKTGIGSSFGTGYGGQKGGFYCWTTEEQADKCFARWAIGVDAEWAKKTFGLDMTLKDGNALKIEVEVDENKVKYPNYQIDNEQHANKNRGRERALWLDFWEAQKDLFNKNNRLIIDDKSYCLGYDEEKHCPTLIATEGNKPVTIYVDSTRAEDSLRTQAINDYLCEKYPTYRDNYNKLLLAAAFNQNEVQIENKILHPKNIALKYCGEEKLQDIKISKMHSDFSSGEKIENAKRIDYGEHQVCYMEHEVFSSQRKQQICEKIGFLQAKIKHQSGTIENLRGIGIVKVSAPVNKQTLNMSAICVATKQNEG